MNEAANPKIQINAQRLLADLHELAEISEPNTPGWTRRFPSEAYQRGRAWVRARFENEGLLTHIDAAGNLFGGRDGREAIAPIASGSHTDTVMAAGRFDGMLGVLGALEAARAIREAGIRLRHPLVVADYLSEEATDYAIACLGSMVLATGDFKHEWLDRSVNGTTLRQAISDMGGKPDALRGPLLMKGAFAASLELHIEQGPVMEAAAARLAAVSGIVGIHRAIFEINGTSNHAGATPMNLRNDAIAALGQMIVAIEAIAKRHAPNGHGAVGTIGRIEVAPNQANVIANQVNIHPEMRSLNMAELDAMWAEFLALARRECVARGVTLELFNQTRLESAVPPDWLHETVWRVCNNLDSRAIRTPSGAGHDTNHLSIIAPSAMIFVPSVNGRSHAPEEYTAPADLALGVQALAECIVEVDKEI